MGSTHFSLRPAAPFRLDLTAWCLRRRPDNCIDRWDGETYRRVVLLEDAPVEVAVRQAGTPEAPQLHVTATGAPSAPHREHCGSLAAVRGLPLLSPPHGSARGGGIRVMSHLPRRLAVSSLWLEDRIAAVVIRPTAQEL